MIILENKASCFDDYLLVPQHSEVKSRLDISLEPYLGETLGDYKLPIINSPMDSIVSVGMLDFLGSIGAIPVVPRRWLENDFEKRFLALPEHIRAFVSIGLSKEDIGILKPIRKDKRFAGVLVDIAHGDTPRMTEQIKLIGKVLGHSIPIIAGNVATSEGFSYLAKTGVEAIRVGIGGGSVCTTRIITGHGVPTMQSLIDIEENDQYGTIRIADGGIRNSGDGAKALATGANILMLGNILAATDLCNSDYWSNGKFRYEGQASREYQGVMRAGTSPEGETVYLSYRGETADVIDEFLGGLRSALSYSGAKNLNDFWDKAILQRVSNMTIQENRPHAKGV